MYVAGSGRKGRLGLPRASLSNAMTSDEDPNNMALNEPFLLEYFPSVSCSVDFIAVGGAHSFALCLDEGIKTGGEMRGIPSDSRSIAIGDGITDPEAQKDAVHGPLKTGTWHEFRVQTRDIFGKDCRASSYPLSVCVRDQKASVSASVSSSETDIEGWAEDTDLRGSGERRQRIQVKVCDRKTEHIMSVIV